MKKVYLLILLFITSIISASLFTYFSVLSDKQIFLLKVDKLFNGKDIVSDGNGKVSYLTLSELDNIENKKLKEKIYNQTNSYPTAVSSPLGNGYNYLVLEKNIEEGELVGFINTIHESYYITYKDQVDDYFRNHYSDIFEKVTTACYESVVENNKESYIFNIYDDILSFAESETKYYFLEFSENKNNSEKSKFQTSCGNGHISLYFGNRAEFYNIRLNNAKIKTDFFMNFGYSFLGCILLILIMWLSKKILTK